MLVFCDILDFKVLIFACLTVSINQNNISYYLKGSGTNFLNTASNK